MRAYLMVILLLLVIFGGIGGYLFRQFSALSSMDFSAPAVTVSAATAQLQEWHSELAAIGTLRAVRGVELSSESSGAVIAVDVASGDRVQRGDLLVTLNDSVEQASRENQQAALELARLLFDRDQQLIKQKSIPQSQYDRSRADLDSAIAQLAETEALLDNKRIRAPFAGTIGIVHVRVGSYLQPGDPVTALQDLSALEIDFTVPARHYPLLRLGQSVAVRVDALPKRVFAATLQAIDSRADADTRNLLLRATLEPDSGLLPGMFAQLTLDLGDSRSLVTVPETAVTYSLQGNIIWVLERSGDAIVATPRVVTTGAVRDGHIAILNGLEAGAVVASSGQNKLSRGTHVIIDDSVELEGL
ncbi:MAG: efflux RND transporter periplasmic adaptor subunit [Halieaceae bacterium]|nr:efflux RND transporter periplasmic adaptor subunit [Halieaceae bacterium]MCP5146502.1 efflux RND transporter periplasmic adaptor subunit [Pseudomonadales bacterium]MCP5166406.1 efflux RND transporter periplasmic adaptor subunit [Pseudomonadales bacterium]MCP5186300.1 efflux RND transporter periplasmic adaptor subunit [Pseudomonadales bacterium]